MIKKGHHEILRIERNFFGESLKNIFGPPTPSRAAAANFLGPAIPPTKIDRSAAADTMTLAHGSSRGFRFKNWGSSS